MPERRVSLPVRSTSALDDWISLPEDEIPMPVGEIPAPENRAPTPEDEVSALDLRVFNPRQAESRA